MNLRKFIHEALYENPELNFWIKGCIVFFILFNIFGVSVSKDAWDDLYDLINSILVNILAAFMFYILVVYIPEKKAKKIRRKNFKIVFETTELTILEILSQAVEAIKQQDLEKLLKPDNAKTFFTDSNLSKFKKFLNENNISIISIVTELEILKEEILYLITKIEISDHEVYDFLKNLSFVIQSYKIDHSKNNDLTILLDFLVKLFTGYNWSKKQFTKDNIFENILHKI